MATAASAVPVHTAEQHIDRSSYRRRGGDHIKPNSSCLHIRCLSVHNRIVNRATRQLLVMLLDTRSRARLLTGLTDVSYTGNTHVPVKAPPIDAGIGTSETS